jgi:hypothetical protein
MRKTGMIFLALVLMLAGGCINPNKAFVEGVEAYTEESGMLDEYCRYVDQDETLPDDMKAIRKDTAAGLRKLVKEYKRQLEEEE